MQAVCRVEAAIGSIIDIVTPTEAQNIFAAAGYDLT
jgi:hypothetical protein